jgi:hypothetical protein
MCDSEAQVLKPGDHMPGFLFVGELTKPQTLLLPSHFPFRIFQCYGINWRAGPPAVVDATFGGQAERSRL